MKNKKELYNQYPILTYVEDFFDFKGHKQPIVNNEGIFSKDFDCFDIMQFAEWYYSTKRLEEIEINKIFN